MNGRNRTLFALGCALLLSVGSGRGDGAASLAWETGEGFRSAKVSPAAGGNTGFRLLPPTDTSVTFTNRLSDAEVAANRLLENGSGVALGDVDGDGWVDIYFCRLSGDNVLYRNLGGWKFEDITANSGVACPGQFSTGCALADLDGDGDLDLLVNSLGGGTRAFFNDGHGHFTEQKDSKLASRSGATSMALADVDGDGDLDLYVTHYRTDTVNDNPPGLRMTTGRAADGTPLVEPRDRFLAVPNPIGGAEVLEKGEGDQFYVNKGGSFIPAPWNVGVFLDEDGKALSGPPPDWGLAVMFRDFNGDGLPDLYVCNDFVYWPDRLWLNVGGKRFRAAPRTALRHYSLSSMAVDAADINRDGFDDLFVADMLNPRREARAWQRPFTLAGILPWPLQDPEFRPEVARNTLQLARGDGTFAEIAPLAGVSATEWTWSAAFLDVDLDGWEDLLIANGSNHDVQDADLMSTVGRTGAWKTPEKRLQFLAGMAHRPAASIALRNRHDLTFEDTSAAWGFGAVGVAHGMAFADLDNDGDLDVVINCLNSPARLLRNDSPAPRLAVRLKGAGGNTRGIGAKIKVTGGPVAQTQEMIAGGRYCSSDDAMRVFAAGNATDLDIEVTWRSGRHSVVKGAKPDRIYEIDEATAPTAPAAEPPSPIPMFEDVSAQLHHTHVDEPFDDFARQPLLPHKLSTLGPGVAWADLDGDGHDELIVSGGKGGRSAVFRNDGHGNLTAWTNAPVPAANPRDQAGLVVSRGADGAARLIVGESNWEDADSEAPPFRIFPFGKSPATNPPPRLASFLNSTGPLALADTDGDGDLDLFVGARAVAGRYPEPATSLLLRNDGGTFVVGQTFADLGLVSGAVFTDVDGDGDPDLALACDWGAVRVFRNDAGKFTEITSSVGLAKLTGCWNGIAAGDFDGDGRMDLVASNWGRNWRIDQPGLTDLPARLFYGDFADNGGVQTLLASLDPALSLVTPWRQFHDVSHGIPAVASRIADHHAYGRAGITTVLGDHATDARELVATVPDSMVFLNRGDHFEARPLPIQAQFAPAFGVSVADFDGDGHEDVFLAQNFFGVDPESARQDAGTGLILLGDGRGGFRALGPRESGFSIYGEGRGSAVADFDEDGRPDLAVGQQGGPTRLLRNQAAKPGVRVVLRGTKENPDAVGSVVRLKSDDHLGPAREIHAGSGYWSQDSAALVLAAPAIPTGLQVRWPNGKTQEFAWPAGQSSVEVSAEGIRGR